MTEKGVNMWWCGGDLCVRCYLCDVVCADPCDDVGIGVVVFVVCWWFDCVLVVVVAGWLLLLLVVLIRWRSIWV